METLEVLSVSDKLFGVVTGRLHYYRIDALTRDGKRELYVQNTDAIAFWDRLNSKRLPVLGFPKTADYLCKTKEGEIKLRLKSADAELLFGLLPSR